ncbi:MAG: hypothetical protein V4510_11385 [bacterium]
MASKTRKRVARKPARAKKTVVKARKAAGRRHAATDGLYGSITHTELASADPAATKRWCEGVLGWTFKPSLPLPTGEYHLFTYSDQGGGGIRQTAASEAPCVTPTVHVANVRATYEKALRAGATSVQAPKKVMPGVVVAAVRIPGGIVVGFGGGS